uniref:Uncharacterized protein n=1 Tax=Sus scrofa TaxID=9823 RepID=A0A4X1V3L0_PIG
TSCAALKKKEETKERNVYNEQETDSKSTRKRSSWSHVESHLPPYQPVFPLQIFVQGCLAGKNLSHVKGGCLLCGYLKLLPMFSIVMPGMISRVLYTDKVACVVPSECEKYCGARTGCSPIAYPVLVVELLPIGFRGLMVSALWAALISSLTSVFNGASAVFTMDIYTQLRPMATEKELMLTGRFFVIILLAISIAWAPAIHMAHREQMFEYMQAIISYLTPPVAAIFLLAIFCKRVTEQLHRLCWSLRNSQEERVDLDEEIQGRNPEPQAQPDVFQKAKSCLWRAWDVFCGLEPLQSSKLAPGDVMVQKMECGDMEGTQHGDTLEGTEQRDTVEGIEPQDMPEKPCWRKVANICGFLLVSLTVFCHIYFG